MDTAQLAHVVRHGRTFVAWEHRRPKLLPELPNLTDVHTGENIADSVLDILKVFELRRDKIGYFILPNVSNDNSMEEVAETSNGLS